MEAFASAVCVWHPPKIWLFQGARVITSVASTEMVHIIQQPKANTNGFLIPRCTKHRYFCIMQSLFLAHTYTHARTNKRAREVELCKRKGAYIDMHAHSRTPTRTFSGSFSHAQTHTSRNTCEGTRRKAPSHSHMVAYNYSLGCARMRVYV